MFDYILSYVILLMNLGNRYSAFKTRFITWWMLLLLYGQWRHNYK